MRPAALFLVIALAGAACSSSGDGGRSDAITFQVTADTEEAFVYETLVSAFTRENPDIDVELVAIANKDDHLARLATSFAGGEPPDVFLVNFREFSQFVARGAVEPAGPLLEGAGLDPSDYYEQPLEAFTYDGALQCWPQNISSLVVYFNTALFERAGLDPPEPGWSLADFRSTALALKEARDQGELPDDVDPLGLEPGIIRVAPFVWSSGGEMVDDLDAPTRFTLDEPAARTALEFILGLVRDDEVVPTEEEIASQDLETRFASGKLGMFLSSRRDTPVFREQSRLEWDVAALPVADEPASILHSDAYCFSREAGNLEDAVTFASYALGDDGQTITALGGRTVPSLRSVAESGAFLDPVQPPESSQVFLDAIPVLRRTPVIPTWPEIEDLSDEILLRAFYEDGYTLDEALADLDRVTRPLFEEGAP